MQVRDACWAVGLRGGKIGAGEEVVGWFAGVVEFEPGGFVRGLFGGDRRLVVSLTRYGRRRESGGFESCTLEDLNKEFGVIAVMLVLVLVLWL